jgi:anaerobic dimethyl sulfoxide reductase subunit C (anchor subunit)
MTRDAAQVELLQPVRQRVWGIPAVANFALGGIGAGFYVAAALAARLDRSPALALAAWLGPALVLAGFAAVAGEAGRPLRGPRVLARVATSWMSRELVLGGLFAALALGELLWPAAALRAGAVAAALALAAAQGVLVQRARAVAAWDVPVMPLLFVGSALVSGAGLLLVVEAVLGRPAGGALLGGSLTVLLLALVVWLTYVTWTPEAPFATATRRLREGGLPVALVAVAYAVPWVLGALALALPALAPAAALAGLLMLAGQVWTKWLLILTVATLRPITLGALTLERRVS